MSEDSYIRQQGTNQAMLDEEIEGDSSQSSQFNLSNSEGRSDLSI